MADPSGTWTVNANGFTGPLNIAVDGEGNITGDILGDTIRGTWDGGVQRMSFERIGANQFYEGALTIGPFVPRFHGTADKLTGRFKAVEGFFDWSAEIVLEG